VGSDNLFHKRKAKQARDLRRKQSSRAPYDKILIVCEGEKTEPNYFKELTYHYRLNTVNIEVRGDCGSDPMSVVDFAKQRYREENDKRDPFDKVYCVFDKDSHSTYQQALDVIEAAKPKHTFHATTSVPSFEFWLLLHFIGSTKPYQHQHNSAAKQVEKELRQYLQSYKKGDRGVFTQLTKQLNFALSNADKMFGLKSDHHDNPSTRVHLLVQELQKLAKR